MKIWEINQALEALLEQVDPETGELTCDLDALEALTMAREDKIEGIALAIKNMRAEADAIYNEVDVLSKRGRGLKNHADRLAAFLERELDGQKFHTAKVDIGFRATESVNLSEAFMKWALENDKYLRYKDPEPDKTQIKKAIKAGETIPGAEIVRRQSMSIE